MKKSILLPLLLSLVSLPAVAQDHSPVLGFNLLDHWFAPVEHLHSSSLGTQFVHPIGLETAFTGRKVFFDFGFTEEDGGTEHELEFEFEYALTRRLGFVFEVPFVIEGEAGEEADEGFGDIAIGTRLLLAEYKRFLLSLNLEFELPTADDGFTSDEVIFEPALLAWFDLGKGFTLQTAFGLERGFTTRERELFFSSALIYSIPNFRNENDTLSFTLESNSEIGIQGDEDGEVNTTGLAGLIYTHNHWSIRGGYQFPVTNPKELDQGYRLGLIYDF